MEIKDDNCTNVQVGEVQILSTKWAQSIQSTGTKCTGKKCTGTKWNMLSYRKRKE